MNAPLIHIQALLESLLDNYQKTHTPIEINFRESVNWINKGERYSHLIHPYPAKLLSHIPYLFINNELLSSQGDRIFDPFCGSGTVALEALLANRRFCGAECNPLARLISKVKTTYLRSDIVRQELSKLLKIKFLGKRKYPNVVNINFWYTRKKKEFLHDLLFKINSVDDQNIKDFFLVCFSNLVTKVSNADPRIKVPVKINIKKFDPGSTMFEYYSKYLKSLKKVNLEKLFIDIVEDNIYRISTLENRISSQPIQLSKNALLTGSHINDIQLAITSPPYAGAQKYVRSTSLNLGWLGFCNSNSLRDFETKTIGREHYTKNEYKNICKTGIIEADKEILEIYNKSPIRSYIISNYLNEMIHVVNNLYNSISNNGFLVLVIANNNICGKEFKTANILRDICIDKGFKLKLELVDHIKSRGLMTKRNKTSGLINSEYVYLLKKER